MEEKKNNKKRKLDKELLAVILGSVNVAVWYAALELRGRLTIGKFLEALVFGGLAIFVLNIIGAAVAEAVCKEEKVSKRISTVALWLGVTAAILFAILH